MKPFLYVGLWTIGLVIAAGCTPEQRLMTGPESLPPQFERLPTTGGLDFETPAYSSGNINGQDGWSRTGAYDSYVVTNSGAPASFGLQSLRISNAITSGSFGDQTFSRPVVDESGETNAYVAAPSGTRKSRFAAQWDFVSAAPAAEQAGLSVVVSPDKGDGGRMSWIQLADTPGGLEVNFYDYRDAAPFGSAATPADGYGVEDDFVFTNVASGLNRATPHTIRVEMELLDGPRNDVVRVYVDGVLRHTGTSWEDYFRWVQGPGGPEQTAPVHESRVIRSLLFRVGGTAVPALAGGGFLIDNVVLESSAPPTPNWGSCFVEINGTTYKLLSDCTTTETLVIPNGYMLDGNGFTITAEDPSGGHFLGAVVKNGGATANVTGVTITASGLANVCDDGVNRLRGILFEGAAGAITNSAVLNVNQGPSGCQEGNAIEARNEPFDNTGADLLVTISGNTVSGYIKNGITANGSVAATITNNIVTGSGPVGVPLAAQNGIQIGFGATATVKGNTITGNNYTPRSWVACGLLLYQADGVKASANPSSGNEKDLCNYGKGGGNFNPAP